MGCGWIVGSYQIEGAYKMPRIARLKVKGEPAVYHAMPRTALNGFVLGNVEKVIYLI